MLKDTGAIGKNIIKNVPAYIVAARNEGASKMIFFGGEAINA